LRQSAVIDCRLVCTPSCDWAPRLSTGVNAVSTWPCGWALRASTAGRSATGLATVAASGVTRHGLSCDRAIGRPSHRWMPSYDGPAGLTSIQIRYSLLLRAGVSVLGRGPDCSKAAGPSTARSRTPESRDEEGSRSTALRTRTSLDGGRSLSHRLATLRTDQLKGTAANRSWI